MDYLFWDQAQNQAEWFVPALLFCLLMFDSCVIQLGLIESLLLDAWNTKECTKYFLISFLTCLTGWANMVLKLVFSQYR